VHDGRPILGAVAWPTQGRVYGARTGAGAFYEERSGKRTPLKTTAVRTLADCRFIVSRTHRDARLDALLARLPKAEQIVRGGLGCKLCSIALGEAEVYIGLSGRTAPRDWDTAAPEIVLREAGGAVSRFDGTPILYNREDTYLWGGIVASNGPTHGEWSTVLPRVLAEVDGG